MCVAVHRVGAHFAGYYSAFFPRSSAPLVIEQPEASLYGREKLVAVVIEFMFSSIRWMELGPWWWRWCSVVNGLLLSLFSLVPGVGVIIFSSSCLLFLPL